MRVTSLAATAIACGTLLASLSTGALAQTATGTGSPTTAAKPHPNATCGKITAITADHLSITPDSGAARSTTVGDATRYLARSLDAARHGLHEGDYARAASAAAGGAARVVEWGEVDFCGLDKNGDQRFVGSVLSSTPNSVTFQDRAGDAITTNFTQATKFYVDGTLVQNPPAFLKGKVVRVLAHRESDNSLNALTVAIGRATPANNERLKGSVLSSTGNSITFQDLGQDAVTVNLTPATKFFVAGKRVQNPPAFTSGEKIHVVAHLETDKSLNALVVAVTTS